MKSCITISLVEEARGGPVCSVGRPGKVDRVRRRTWLRRRRNLCARASKSIDADALGKMLDNAGIEAGRTRHRCRLGQASLAAGRSRCRQATAGPRLRPHHHRLRRPLRSRRDHRIDAGTERPHRRCGRTAILAEALEDGGAHAAQYNVPLIYEPLNRYETRQCCTVADGVELLESLSTDNVRLLCDLFHMNIEETDIADALLAGGKWVGHIHFVDSNRRPVGNGHMQYGPIIAALASDRLSRLLVRRSLPLARPPRSGTANDARVQILDGVVAFSVGRPFAGRRCFSVGRPFQAVSQHRGIFGRTAFPGGWSTCGIFGRMAFPGRRCGSQRLKRRPGKAVLRLFSRVLWPRDFS